MRLALSLVAVTSLWACGNGIDPPEDHVYAETTQLVQYQSCSALRHDLQDMLIRETWAYIDHYDEGWGYGLAGGVDDASGTSGGGSSGGRQEGVDYSGTNNQETGVDEADLVKTDGYHVYALNGNRLHIYGVPNFGDLVPESVTPIEGHPREMLVDRDAGRAVVFSYINVGSLPQGHPLRYLTGYGETTWYWRTQLVTKITVIDISDRTHPTLVREVYYEGWYQTARKVGSSVRVSTYAQIDRHEVWDWYQIYDANGHDKGDTKDEVERRIRRLTLDDLVPNMYVRTPDGRFTTSRFTDTSCTQFSRPTDSHARGIASIISFDLLGPNLAWDADHVISNWATFYSSQDTIVLAEPAHDWWWYWWFQDDTDQLNVHTFDISQPGKSRYTGSGRVYGAISDQFAIDEDHGTIRLATTTGTQWRWGQQTQPVTENHVWVLEQQGATRWPLVGHIGGIAKGERIMSARFLGDKGYLVTFKRIDPLWTIDLSDSHAPKLVGELQTPGFSTYLHPLGADRLLAIGVGADDAGRVDWRTNISTFDVTDFAHPAMTQTMPIETSDLSWGWSEALYEHKAFQYFAPKQLLAVPQSTWSNTGGTYRYLSRLELIGVTPEGQLSYKGAIDHTPYYQNDLSHYWSYVQIRRSIFMGDYIYAISDKAITVHRTSDLGLVTAQLLPGYIDNDYWWWW